MKIFEFCMFHNEFEILEIKKQENAHWVDEIHLCESNRTFKKGDRALILGESEKAVKHHVYDGALHFHPYRQWGISRQFPFIRQKEMARKNETLQRNFVHHLFSNIEDNDLIILSDVDEVIDARYADQIVENAKKYGIISIEMHHTLFYLNLYSTNWHEVWHNSPPNYAYRVFILTGKKFRQLRIKSDRLRRLGEWNRLSKDVHLLRGFKGFHHSWLGDENAAFEKLQSYAHNLEEHKSDLIDGTAGVNKKILAQFIRSGQSIFPGNKLEIRSFDQVEPLKSVLDNKGHFQRFIL